MIELSVGDEVKEVRGWRTADRIYLEEVTEKLVPSNFENIADVVKPRRKFSTIAR